MNALEATQFRPAPTMSIRKASTGILGTHVTWEEFEANLTKALNTTARFGPAKSATDIGEGNVRKCLALIEQSLEQQFWKKWAICVDGF